MDQHHKDLIRRNLPESIERTHCNSTVLAKLVSDRILSAGDVTELNALRSNPQEQALKLYDILESRVNGFDSLVKALAYTNQTGALDILKPELKLDTTSNGTTSNTISDHEFVLENVAKGRTKTESTRNGKPTIFCAILIAPFLVIGVGVLVFILIKDSIHHNDNSNITTWSNTKVFDSTEIVITEDESIHGDTLGANETTVMGTESVVVKQPALQGADEFDGTVPATKPTPAVPEILAPKETTWMVTERDFTSETILPNSNSSEFNMTVPVSKPTKNVTAILAGDETIYLTEPAFISEISVNSANFSIYESTAYAIKPTTKVPTSTTQRITYVPNSINRCDITVLEKKDELTSMLFKVCPDSKKCPCWGDSAQRDVYCKEWNYQERWEIQNFGFYTCYCCGKY